MPDASAVKNSPAMQKTQEMWVRSLGQEDPLKKRMATHPSILAWRIPWTEEPGGLQSMGCTESDTTEATEQEPKKTECGESEAWLDDSSQLKVVC